MASRVLRTFTGVAAVSAMALVAAACGSTAASTGSATSQPAKAAAVIPAANKNPLTMEFGSSGPAETAAEQAAAKAFTKQSGIPVTVIPEPNLTQSIAEGFAGTKPANLFYLSPTLFEQYITKGVLDSYGSALANKNDFYSSLSSAFTYKGQLSCDPKDGSLLSLYINTADWKAAGLTSANYPTSWTQLAAVAKKLTTDGRTGLVMDPNESRIDAFFYQANGSILNAAGTKVVIDSPANIKALNFLKSMLTAKTLVFPSTISDSDEIPAFGQNQAAMVITGNWMAGEMSSDYPKIAYSAHWLPAGPTGTKATLTFTNCWGVAKNNDNLGGTIDFVKFLTSAAQELRFSAEFGTLPSLKTVSAAYTKRFPQNAAVLSGQAFGHPDISLAGSTEALATYNSALTNLATSSAASILAPAQTNLQAVIKENG